MDARTRHRRVSKRSGPDGLILALGAVVVLGAAGVAGAWVLLKDRTQPPEPRGGAVALEDPVAPALAERRAQPGLNTTPRDAGGSGASGLDGVGGIGRAGVTGAGGAGGPVMTDEGSGSETGEADPADPLDPVLLPDDAAVSVEVVRASPHPLQGLWVDLVFVNGSSEALRWFDGRLTLSDARGSAVGVVAIDFPTQIDAGEARAYRLQLAPGGGVPSDPGEAAGLTGAFELGQYRWGDDANPRGEAIAAGGSGPVLDVLAAEYDQDGSGVFLAVPGVGDAARSNTVWRPSAAEAARRERFTIVALPAGAVAQDDPRGTWLAYRLTNASDADVDAFDGVAEYRLPNGELLVRVLLVHDAPLAAGQSVVIAALVEPGDPSVRRVTHPGASSVDVDAEPVEDEALTLQFVPRFVQPAGGPLEAYDVGAFVFPPALRLGVAE